MSIKAMVVKCKCGNEIELRSTKPFVWCKGLTKACNTVHIFGNPERLVVHFKMEEDLK